MTKEEAKKKLEHAGYAVIDDNSVVTVLIAPDADFKKTIKEVKDKLTEWGYNASFGIKVSKSELKSNDKESEDEDEFFDEEDSDMLLNEESIQFSLEDFGLDF